MAEPELLTLLRAYQLAYIRLEKPTGELLTAHQKALDRMYPSKSNTLNRELVQMLVALGSPTVVAKTVPLLSLAIDDPSEETASSLLERNMKYGTAAVVAAQSQPNRQQYWYAYALREAVVGWTPELRKGFFSWFPRTGPWKGGNSFRKFIDNIRTESLAKVSDAEERRALDELSSKAATESMAKMVAPKGPGRVWTVDGVLAVGKDGFKGRNFENGKAMFSATLCLKCHRFGADGGGVGPDLTGAGSRYTLRDLAEHIIDPSKVISDQYDSHIIEKKDGGIVIGRIVVEENGKVFVAVNPFDLGTTMAVDEKEIASKKVNPVSMMPPGLINTLNPDELQDLLAYIMSGGNPQDKVFKAAN
jgi:putative heme-binding domain-containing protein